jgi:shikimate dehydrogenase
LRERLMDVAAVIGFPIRHSLSPAIHNAAFDELGLDWIYLQLAVPPDRPADGVRALRLLRASGANVTMPHKLGVVPSLDCLTAEAEALGAVNTIAREGARLIGHNTDGAGFLAAIREEAGFEPRGCRALIVGAGGAARAVAVALALGGATVTVEARRPRQAEAVAHLAPGIQMLPWGEPADADLVVQATSARQDLPLDALPFGPDVLAVDLIYSPPPTPFLDAAARAGARALGGLGMLVHQAALSFELWTGRRPSIEVMRRAAETSLLS